MQESCPCVVNLQGRLSNWTGFNMVAGVWEAGGGVPMDSTYRLPPLRKIPAELVCCTSRS